MDKGMSITHAPPGTKVRLIEGTGTASARAHAERRLEKGREYTVAHIEVRDWYDLVYLEEAPGFAFNTVLFGEA